VSAIVGIFRTGDYPGPDPAAEGILAGMRQRGTARTQIWHGDGVTLGVGRFPWELEPDFSGPVLVLVDPDVVVAADARLIYHEDLRRKLKGKGVDPLGPSSSHLIAAAYRAWGPNCAEHLEGEFGFLLWDREKKRAFCSRDFLGKRPIYYAARKECLVVASTIGGVVSHPDVPDELNILSIAAAAAGMNAAGPETCYAAVQTLGPASEMIWRAGRVSGPRRHWTPVLSGEGTPSEAEAAEQLRELLINAVRERLAVTGDTTVWLSGGWDSPAVFAAGQEAVRRGAPGHLLPVSISYPVGDPGREDELIQAIAARWNSPVHWIDIGDICLFDSPSDRTRTRDEPFRHIYQRWNEALAGGTRDQGSRVALDGNGGDQIFAVSPVFLADLFASGHWLSLRREWRALGGDGFRSLFQFAIQPALPRSVTSLITQVRGGRPLPGYVERRVPTWITPSIAGELVERDRDHLPRPSPWGAAAAESAWVWESWFVQRAIVHQATAALGRGVEARSPLADRRVVEFGLARPRSERASGGETKRLLRASMRGLLPEHVLARRPHRTGTTDGFSHDQVTRSFLPNQSRLLAGRPCLQEIGIMNTEAFRRAAKAYRHRSQADLRVALLYTYFAEEWLQRRKAEESPEPLRTNPRPMEKVPSLI